MALTKASYSMISGAVVNAIDYGVDPTGVNDCTSEIQAAIAATPPKAKLIFPSGTYKVTASATGALPIENSIEIDFQDSVLLCDTVSANASVIRIAKTANTQAASLGPFGTFAFVNLYDVTIRPSVLVDNDTYDAATDPRTSAYHAVYITEVDSVKLTNITAMSVKGAALFIGSESAVRESVFTNIYAVNCGNQSTQVGAINFLSPVAAAANGIHNHLYFNEPRVINSYWRSIQIMRGASVAAAFGTFIVEFNSGQFDNAQETGVGTGIPAGPQCEMVLMEHCGYHMTFDKCLFFGPYSAATTKWGFPAIRIGTTNYSNSTVESTEITNCRFNQGLNWGVGVQIERANKVRFTQPSFAFQATNEGRTVVVGKFNPADNYGIATDNDIQPYIWFDNTMDMNSGVFYAVASRKNGTFGALVGSDSNLRQFAPNGFYSGSGSSTVAANTTQTINIDLDDYSLITAAGVSYIVTATFANTGAVNPGSVSAIVTCVDSNVVADVLQTGLAASNAGVLTATLGRYGGLAAGTTSAGNGNKVAFTITNNSLTLAAPVNWSVVRLGSIFA